MMQNLFRLFKKAKTKPLPGFPAVSILDVQPASCLLFYSGNKLTEMFGERVYRHPFHPPAFHAAITLGAGMFLNVGKFKTLNFISEEMRSTRRIDVIEYRMDADQREKIRQAALIDADQPKIGLMLPTYGITDYLRFGFPWFKPSERDICSENCLELLAVAGVRGSAKPTYRSAPWDLLTYALDNPEQCIVKTAWIGANFKG